MAEYEDKYLTGVGLSHLVGKIKNEINNKVSRVFTYKGSGTYRNGTVTVNNVPVTTYNVGDVYNITAQFTTDGYFEEGSDKVLEAGTNIVVSSSVPKTFDVLGAFADVDIPGMPEAYTAEEIEEMFS